MNERRRRQRDVLRALRRGSQLVESHRLPREQIEYHRDQRLRSLVHHAREHSPFHAERMRGLDLDAPDLLARLPTMDKQSMMEDLPRVLTAPRLRQIDLDAHLANLEGDGLLMGCYRVMASGGTSGVRGLFVYDEAAWVAVMGTFATAPKWLGVPPRFPRPRIATVWASGPAHMTARLAASFHTPIYRRLALAARMPIAELVEQLNEFRPVWLSAYPSIAALLATEQQAGRLNIAPRVVVVSSEQCTPAMRARIATAWSVEPFDTYATTEASTTAIECERHTGMHVFESQLILEVVDADLQPVPDGEPGAKILVTNLFNRVQPLIRYELTDLLTMAPDPCPCGRTSRRIQSIDGRTDDIMYLQDRSGREVPVHPNHFAEAIEVTAGVHAYQVTEHADRIDITLVCSQHNQDDVAAAIMAGVRDRLKPLGVDHTPLKVTIAAEIARPDAASGKFKLVRARQRHPNAARAGHNPAART